MTEEQKSPTVGRPPMDYYARLETLDEVSFSAEIKKKSLENLGVECLTATIARVLLGDVFKGNDPYALSSRGRKKGEGFEIKGSKERKVL